MRNISDTKSDPAPRIGIVRRPGKSYKDCIRTNKLDIDIEKAKEQHQAYTDVISGLGIDLIQLKQIEAYPDSCFIEDTAVIVGEKAIICRLKPITRRGEEKEIADLIGGYMEVFHIRPPATLEGGDLIVAPEGIYAGRSSRSNDYGIGQLMEILGDSRDVIPIDIADALHLKSLCTLIDKKTLLVREGLDFKRIFKGYQFIEAPHEEWNSANAISINGKVLMPKGNPITMGRIREMGYEVIELDISEFIKGGGGVTCLSILF